MARRPAVEELLLVRLREELGLALPAGTRLVRTRYGYWQRKQGAWSWRAESPDGPLVQLGGRLVAVGSQSTMTALVRASRLRSDEHLGDLAVEPEEEVF